MTDRFPGHDPRTCPACVRLNQQLAHPVCGGRRPVIPGQRGRS